MNQVDAGDLVVQNNRLNAVKIAASLPSIEGENPLRVNNQSNVNGSTNDSPASLLGGTGISNSTSGNHQSSVTVIPVDQQEDHFVVGWKNLTYTIGSVKSSNNRSSNPLPNPGKKKNKTIFNSLTGQFKSGEITALMGPSGSGKSTLLECIAGIRRKGRFGEVSFSGFNKVKMAFIPQSDHFIQSLTVRECLEFASQFMDAKHLSKKRGNLKHDRGRRRSLGVSNFRKSKVTSKEGNELGGKGEKGEVKTSDIVDQVIEQLNLESCENTYIRQCSGGQLKRLSVAQELIARPQILLLDEPTSGLDSLSCLQTIELLHHLATTSTPPLAILLTIHQPPARVFSLFHSVYALCSIGRCVYEGAPSDIIRYLSKFGLEVPPFSNVADYLVEASSGAEGLPVMKEMALEHERYLH